MSSVKPAAFRTPRTVPCTFFFLPFSSYTRSIAPAQWSTKPSVPQTSTSVSSPGDGSADVIQIDKGQKKAPNLVSLLRNRKITKIFHFARFDLAVLSHAFGAMPQPVFCTKIASRLTRTYTDRHGLKDISAELLGVTLSKAQQSSDWAAETLSEEQLEYAASDVLYLHRLRAVLAERLEREARTREAEACFGFLPTRARLDLMAGRRPIFSPIADGAAARPCRPPRPLNPALNRAA